MRKFRYRLQGLEDIKGMELDALRQAYASAREELRRSEQELLNLRAALDSTYSELMDLRIAQTDPLILLSLESYAAALREQIRAVAQRIADQRAAPQEARENLALKRKEKKVLEKYRERKLTEYGKYVEREMQKELDETAANIHLRREHIT
jgi:flagellar export protein FliJ